MLGTISTLSELLNFKTSTGAFYGEAAEGFYCFLSSGRAETEAASEAVHNKITGFLKRVYKKSAPFGSSTLKVKPDSHHIKLRLPDFVVNSAEFLELNIPVDPKLLAAKFPQHPLEGKNVKVPKDADGISLMNGDVVYMGLSTEGSLPNVYKIDFKNGGCYEGQLYGGEPHGFGTFKYKGRYVYEGGFHRGLQHGYGVHSLPNKAKYLGFYENNKREGIGCIISSTGVCSYIGSFSNGYRNGKGIHVNPDGSIYIGDFINGRFHGEGWYIFPEKTEGGTRDQYKGLFANDFKEGEGIYIFGDRSIPPLVGFWCRGVWQGTAAIEDNNRRNEE